MILKTIWILEMQRKGHMTTVFTKMISPRDLTFNPNNKKTFTIQSGRDTRLLKIMIHMMERTLEMNFCISGEAPLPGRKLIWLIITLVRIVYGSTHLLLEYSAHTISIWNGLCTEFSNTNSHFSEQVLKTKNNNQFNKLN